MNNKENRVKFELIMYTYLELIYVDCQHLVCLRCLLNSHIGVLPLGLLKIWSYRTCYYSLFDLYIHPVIKALPEHKQGLTIRTINAKYP